MHGPVEPYAVRLGAQQFRPSKSFLILPQPGGSGTATLFFSFPPSRPTQHSIAFTCSGLLPGPEYHIQIDRPWCQLSLPQQSRCLTIATLLQNEVTDHMSLALYVTVLLLIQSKAGNNVKFFRITRVPVGSEPRCYIEGKNHHAQPAESRRRWRWRWRRHACFVPRDRLRNFRSKIRPHRHARGHPFRRETSLLSSCKSIRFPFLTSQPAHPLIGVFI
jgi:hypothetical protein